MIEYMGGYRRTLRGHVSKRVYGSHNRHDRFEVLLVDVEYAPQLFVRV